MIAVLLPLLAQLFGAVGIPVNKVQQQPEKQIVYVQTGPASSQQQPNGVHVNRQPAPASSEQPSAGQSQPIQSNHVNGKIEPAPIGVQQATWDPFSPAR